MALSSWPEKFRDKEATDVHYVTVPFEEETVVAVDTGKAIGVRAIGTRDELVWIPRSVIEEVPEEPFEELRLAKKFADDHCWEYED